jgi:hypothetical protein
MARKTFMADHACTACGYAPNVRRAKADMTVVWYNTDDPFVVYTRCLMCQNVKALVARRPHDMESSTRPVR